MIPGTVHAVSDVHGRYDLMSALIAAIVEEAGDLRAEVIMLGDYGDRGPDSRSVIEFLMKSHRGADILCLKGNHDDLMVRAWKTGDVHANLRWLRQGGAETLRSYGWKQADVPDVRRYVPKSHIDFLDALPTFFDDGERYFVHAGVDPDVPLDDQDPHDAMWIRNGFLDCEENFGRYVVHGHTIVKDGPETHRHRVAIDTGAYRTGILTCAAFEPGTIYPRFIQAYRPPSRARVQIYRTHASPPAEYLSPKAA